MNKKRWISVAVVLVMLVGIALLSFLGQGVEANDDEVGPSATPIVSATPLPSVTPKPEEMVVELNGTRQEIIEQLFVFIDNYDVLRDYFVDMIDYSDKKWNDMVGSNFPYNLGTSIHISLVSEDNSSVGLGVGWTKENKYASDHIVYGVWNYEKEYEMLLEYQNHYWQQNDKDYVLALENVVFLVTMQYPKHSFNDLANHWGEDDILWAYDNEFMNGIDHTYFAPNGTLTRAMIVTILGRCWGDWLYSMYDGDRKTFKDSEVGLWWNPYVEWAVQRGIVEGFEDGTFRPYEEVTRQDLATIIFRYIDNLPEYNIDSKYTQENKLNGIFSDFKDVSQYAINGIYYLHELGVVNGIDDGTFQPKAKATRAQVAKMIRVLFRELGGRFTGAVG